MQQAMLRHLTMYEAALMTDLVDHSRINAQENASAVIHVFNAKQLKDSPSRVVSNGRMAAG